MGNTRERQWPCISYLIHDDRCLIDPGLLLGLALMGVGISYGLIWGLAGPARSLRPARSIHFSCATHCLPTVAVVDGLGYADHLIFLDFVA